MILPGTSGQKQQETVPAPTDSVLSPEEQLTALLQSVKGAGKVKVLLSYAEGERIIYQTDTDEESGRSDTVTVNDSDRNQNGLITQTLPPVFRGAVIVCQGAGDPSVRLSIVEAVSKFTGLGVHQIAVLEMK